MPLYFYLRPRERSHGGPPPPPPPPPSYSRNRFKNKRTPWVYGLSLLAYAMMIYMRDSNTRIAGPKANKLISRHVVL
jgi:hypothetical protein